MKRFTYKTKEGKVIESDTPLKDKGLKLITKIHNGQMENNKIYKK